MCPVLPQERHWALVFFSLTKQRKQVMSPSLVWAFDPEFKSLSIKSRFRAGKRRIITYDYQMHQCYWFRMALCNLALQEKTSGYLAVERRQAVVHTTELFQVFSLSPAYPGCVWTGHIISCVRSKVPWRPWSPHRAGAACPYRFWCVRCIALLVTGWYCTPTHYSSFSVLYISSGCLWHLTVS